MAKTEVYLLRHAQTIPKEGVANKDWVLSEEGKAQAEKLVQPLEELAIDVVYSSPYIRAKETLQPFLNKSGLECQESIDFGEIKAAEQYMDPLDFQTLSKKMIEDIKFVPESGESIEACQYRFMMAVNRIVKEHWGKKILICSHGLPIFAALKAQEPKLNYDDWSRITMPAAFKLITSVEEGGRWDRKFKIDLE